MDEINLRVCGQAGQGLQVLGTALGRAYKNAGRHVFMIQDNMSRIRGGNNFFQLRVSQAPVSAPRQKADIVAALDLDSIDSHRKALNEKGRLILDAKAGGDAPVQEKEINIPFYEISKNACGDKRFVNSVLLGILARMTGLLFESVESSLVKAFSSKGESVIQKNLQAARAGYDHTPGVGFSMSESNPPVSQPRLLMNGNEAMVMGAMAAGCRFYTAYPMSPSTSIMTLLARYAKPYGMIVEQAEDEISAVNMALGASFAGARSLTSTSGGGFCLMTEGVSLSGMTETPLVIINAQRPGPATGFPTRTEQSDLDLVIHGGHGEFAKMVLAPGTIEEAFLLTGYAFQMAEKYQIPVIILTDQYLAESQIDTEPLDINRIKAAHAQPPAEADLVHPYKRYALTESGVSPRGIPSLINEVVYADSDEHTEEGHITESADTRVRMVEKRYHKKTASLLKETMKPKSFQSHEADTLLVGFGSTQGVIKEVCERLQKLKIGCLHLPQVWPFPSQAFIELTTNIKHLVVVENNATGQLRRLIRRETGLEADASVLKFDGRPFSVDELHARVEEVIGSWK